MISVSYKVPACPEIEKLYVLTIFHLLIEFVHQMFPLLAQVHSRAIASSAAAASPEPCCCLQGEVNNVEIAQTRKYLITVSKHIIG